MVINSLEFLVFVAIVVLIYFVSPKKVRWVVLLISSYLFYFLSSSFLTVFLIITTISIYVSALKIGKINENIKQQVKNCTKEEKKVLKQKANKKKKIVIILAILLNIGILAVLKYTNFFSGNINSLLSIFNIQFRIPLVNWILPLGISYYTLQALSYVIDVYREKIMPDKNLGRVSLFLVFFPQIVEGPIGRYDKLANQLYEPHEFSYTNLKFGVQLMIWGYFKKMVIADRAALLVDPIFANYTQYSGVILIIAILLYTLQIYAEFSGCMDIVRGTAQIFGINLDKNFERPFFSRSVQEFWRRWNITLGTWLKDYVFYSVSFSKVTMKITGALKKVSKGYLVKLIPAAFALFFVWLCNGLWHGASWKYICYGLYYYIIMVLGMALEPLGKKVIEKLKINTKVFSYKLWQTIRTGAFVCVGMLIFRAPTLEVAGQIFKNCLRVSGLNDIVNGKIFTLGFSIYDALVLILAVGILIIVSILQEKGHEVRKDLSKQNLVFRWEIYYIAIFAIIVFGIYGPGYNPASFIYGNF